MNIRNLKKAHLRFENTFRPFECEFDVYHSVFFSLGFHSIIQSLLTLCSIVCSFFSIIFLCLPKHDVVYQIERARERTAARDILSLALYLTIFLYIYNFFISMCVVRVLFKYSNMASICCSCLCRSEMDLKAFCRFFCSFLLKTHDQTRSNRRTIWVINYIVQLDFFFHLF